MKKRIVGHAASPTQAVLDLSAMGPGTAISGKSSTGCDWKVICGDSAEILRTLPDKTFGCIVTSPPYYWLRDYGIEGQIGQEDSVGGYVTAIAAVMDEAYRVLAPTGVLFLNLGDTYYSGKGMSHGIDKKSGRRRFGLRAVDRSGGLDLGIKRKGIIGIPWRVAIEMSKRNWVLRSPIIWHRKSALPETVTDRPRRSYEYVFMFVKDRKYYFNRKPLQTAKVEEDLWTIAARPKSTNGIETAPFPDELVERCLSIGAAPGSQVLDPFMGSGTTLRVAISMQHAATGIDLNPKFCAFAAKKLGAM